MKKIYIIVVLIIGTIINFSAKAQARVPLIVYSGSFLGQVGTISPTVLYTPSSEGLYRVSVSGYLNSTSNCSSILTDVWWNGATNPTNQPEFTFSSFAFVPTISGCNVGQVNNPITFVSQPGEPIQIQTRQFNGSYDLFITVEQLQ